MWIGDENKNADPLCDLPLLLGIKLHHVADDDLVSAIITRLTTCTYSALVRLAFAQINVPESVCSKIYVPRHHSYIVFLNHCDDRDEIKSSYDTTLWYNVVMFDNKTICPVKCGMKLLIPS